MEESIFIAKRGNKLPYFDFSIFSNPYEKGARSPVERVVPRCLVPLVL